jgi:hypothetical protein
MRRGKRRSRVVGGSSDPLSGNPKVHSAQPNAPRSGALAVGEQDLKKGANGKGLRSACRPLPRQE